MFTRHTLPIHEPFLPGLARRLLDVCGDCLPRALVLLPSTRACESLRHALLEASGSDGLLLPRVTTPGSLVDDLADRLGDTSPVDVPGDLRAAVLAPRLSTLDWLQDQPGAAAGMAEQMVRLFDELRRHELDPGDLDDGGPHVAGPDTVQRTAPLSERPPPPGPVTPRCRPRERIVATVPLGRAAGRSRPRA